MGNPMIIGVTGHRALRERDIPALRAVVVAELEKMVAAYPHASFVMLNSIASGADSLCAAVALSIGIKLVCPLPMPASEYRKDFSGADAIIFDDLLKRADRVFVVPPAESSSGNATRDDLYRQAGIYVATHCHVLLALWDGSAAKPDGCGTAEMVEFMMRGNAAPGQGAVPAAGDGAVLHIYTPQQNAGQEAFVPKVRLLENEPGRLNKTWAEMDLFNAKAKDAAKQSTNAERSILDDASPGMAESGGERDLRF